MIRVTPGPLHTDPTRRHAVIVLSLATAFAVTATDPWADQPVFAKGYFTGVGPGGDHRAEWFMPERDGRAHAAISHLEALAAAELEVTVANVYVTVTYAAVLEPQ